MSTNNNEGMQFLSRERWSFEKSGKSGSRRYTAMISYFGNFRIATVPSRFNYYKRRTELPTVITNSTREVARAVQFSAITKREHEGGADS